MAMAKQSPEFAAGGSGGAVTNLTVVHRAFHYFKGVLSRVYTLVPLLQGCA